jgi:hypothetical protein
VARVLNAALASRTVYCDGWAHDYPWLGRLYDAAGALPAFRLESAARLLPDATLDGLGAACERARLELGSPRHRASADARVLQRALQSLIGPTAPG